MASCSFQHHVLNPWLITSYPSWKVFIFFLLHMFFTLAMLDLWFCKWIMLCHTFVITYMLFHFSGEFSLLSLTCHLFLLFPNSVQRSPLESLWDLSPSSLALVWFQYSSFMSLNHALYCNWIANLLVCLYLDYNFLEGKSHDLFDFIFSWLGSMPS